MYGKLNNNNSIDFGIKNNLANSWFAFDSDTIFFHSWASKWLRNTVLNVAAFVSSWSGTLHKIISDYNSLTGIGIKTSRWNFRYSKQTAPTYKRNTLPPHENLNISIGWRAQKGLPWRVHINCMHQMKKCQLNREPLLTSRTIHYDHVNRPPAAVVRWFEYYFFFRPDVESVSGWRRSLRAYGHFV